MSPLGRVDDAPPAFRRAVESLRAPAVRPEITIEDIPAPRRLAPHAVALSANVATENDDDAAFGRLIVLFDPEGTRDWPGPFRVVAWVSADLESEIAADPLLGQVAWSWLTDALAARGAGHRELSGTVTRATTEGFAGKADQPMSTELELRASWSPESEELAAHMAVWLDLLSAAAGLPPVDVADIAHRRSRSEG
ncbi:DUF3000 domain-containing protein [Nocardiopsis trehalosi]|jgi:hypothetical protein|uniref:DUF3000 domain-containing protein n=1 Tax=Nocardiopsis trehalosi TaxID=109329 RepID=UPI00082AF16C|nr:DUF3000 domain-containing protein [Nocardiopsis trehalosi]